MATDRRTIVITGAAGGIGAAARDRLEANGDRVIGVDVRGADVIADLSSAAGRAATVEAVDAAAPGGVDGVVAGAGISNDDGPAMVSVNYFGAVATLAGLLPLLARRAAVTGAAAAVAISSNSTTTQPGLSNAIVDHCLAIDEDAARAASVDAGILAYGATKLALARWVRRHATTAEWIGAGVRLNAVAPGFVDTPMTAGGWDFVSSLGSVYPIPIGRPGRAEEVAGLLAYLLSDDASFFCGSVVFMDGGTDAAVRADAWPSAVVA
jgi:NAD(P)-dependent dehydrogenase (short-subunit alcohol dehydrogenase family)